MFRVVHPFHPLRGRELTLVTCRQNWGERRVYLYDEAGRLVSIPLAWTTPAAVDPFVELAVGRSAFGSAICLSWPICWPLSREVSREHLPCLSMRLRRMCQ